MAQFNENYEDPERVLWACTYENLDEISECLLYVIRHDPDCDIDYNRALRNHILRVMKKVRKRNPHLRLDDQRNLD